MSNRPVTYADLAALPEEVVGEIVDGELYTSPRPALRHAGAAAALHLDLGAPFGRGRGGPGGWVLLLEPELHLGADVLVPDLAGWRRARMPEVPDVVGCTLAPDWLAEVLSPSTMRLDRQRKMPRYARAGVPHVWLVDPIAYTLEVLRLEGARYERVMVAEADQVVRAAPFEAIELALASLWAR